jgi:hypothetical protein
MRAVRIASFALLIVLLGAGSGLLSACDSSGSGDASKPGFEAEISGALQTTMRGPAGLASGEEAGNALSGLFAPLPSLPDTTGLFAPDSLRDVPIDSLRPSGTAIFLRDDSEGAGRSISFFLRGDGVPEPGTYSLQIASMGPGSPPVRRPEAEAFAGYSELRDEVFRIAPAAQGTLTVETARADRLRGTFSFSTVLAIDLRLPAPGDTSFTDLFEQQFYQTSISGSFTATRAADAFPRLPNP